MFIKPCFVLLLAFIVQLQVSAQSVKAEDRPLAKPPQFGKITMEEMQMKACSFEKNAPAMNLVQYESVEFTVSPYGDFKLVTETTCRIKIFDKNGYKNASIVIPYVGRNRTSRITDIEASTYNLDEQGNIVVTKINRKDIFRDKAAEKDGLSTVRFAFPNVKEGSVIEYRYTRIEKNSYFIAPWFFQNDMPTQFSACKIKIPAYTILKKHLIALSDVEEGYHFNQSDYVQYRSTERSYCMRDVPSFRAEPFMSSLKDNLQRVEFSLMPGMSMFGMLFNSNLSWEMYNLVFLKSAFFGQQFNKNIPGTDKFIDSLKRYDSLADKVNAVYQYVKKNISWDKHYSFYADDLALVWKEKQGNSAEINISILNLLRKADIACYPVLFSTKENGKVDINFPNASQFNSMDVLVLNRDSIYILDGAESHTSFNVPPLNILNRNAFVVDKDNSKWIHIADDRRLLRDSASIVATLNDDGTLTGEAVISYYDLSRAAKMQEDNHAEDDDESNYLLSDAMDLKIDTSYQVDKDNESAPLKQVMKFHYDLPSTSEFYFLNPFLFSTFSKNPFTDTTRRTEIDFGANSSFNVHMEVTLPKTIKIEELTKNKIIRNTDTALLFSRRNDIIGNTLIVNSSFEINQPIFDKEDYSTISSFFKNIYAILNEQILLKRKEE